jgi:hypothetical protein
VSKDRISETVRLMMKDRTLTADQVMKKFNVKKQYAYNLMSMARRQMRELGIEKVPVVPPVPPAPVQQIELPVVLVDETPREDVVNHPSHYKVGGIETIDFIEAKQLNYHLGNVVKYITRADHKGSRLENLKKAEWYLKREIENAAAH